MKTTNFKSITGQAAPKGAAPRLPGASSRACVKGVVKQITEQLELPLECVYQMALAIGKAGAKVVKNIPNVPYVMQLCFEFSGKKRRSVRRRSWTLITGVIAAGIVGIAGGLMIAAAML